MDKIVVQICTGTACFVMGASEILLLGDELPESLKGKVQIEGMTCMEKCKKSECGKAPFVIINGEVMENASYIGILDKLLELTSKE